MAAMTYLRLITAKILHLPFMAYAERLYYTQQLVSGDGACWFSFSRQGSLALLAWGILLAVSYHNEAHLLHFVFFFFSSSSSSYHEARYTCLCSLSKCLTGIIFRWGNWLVSDNPLVLMELLF